MNDAMKDRDVVFLMVNGVEGPEKAAPYLRDGRFTMTAVFGTGPDNPMKPYQVTGCPTQYVVSRDGKIHSRSVAATRVEIRKMIEAALEDK